MISPMYTIKRLDRGGCQQFHFQSQFKLNKLESHVNKLCIHLVITLLQDWTVCSLLAALHVLLFFPLACPLWPVVRRGRSKRCVSHQVRQDAHWLPAADRSHPGQSAVGELTFSLAPWPWWEVKCVAGSSQYWHSRTRRRRRRNNRRTRKKRTRPEGERFSWPLTPVPVLLPPLNSFDWSHDSLPLATSHRV